MAIAGSVESNPSGSNAALQVCAPKTARSSLAGEVAFRIERAGGEERAVREQEPGRRPGRPAGAGREVDQPGDEHAEADALENAGDAVVLALEREEPGEVEQEPQGHEDGGSQDGLARELAPRRAAARRSPKERAMDTPTRKRKNGKIVSVYVQPCHSAWRRGG